MRFQGEQVLHAAWSWLHDSGLLDLVCLMLCCLILPASCYAAWTSLNHVLCLFLSSWSCYAVWLCLHDATLLGLSTSCLATSRMFFEHPQFWELQVSSRLVSAARSVTHFWFQVEINAAEVRRPKLQILWWTWLSQTLITFIKQKPTHIYCIASSLRQRA